MNGATTNEKKNSESFKHLFQTGSHFQESVSIWYSNGFAPRMRIPGNRPTKLASFLSSHMHGIESHKTRMCLPQRQASKEGLR